jgi:hypothetical protein
MNDMQANYIGGLIAICIIFYLSGVESLEKRDITAITCIGWAIYILFAKGGVKS